MIAEAGVAGVSHRKVADAADVPLGSMTYHFTGMEELLHEAFSRFAHVAGETMNRAIEAAADADATVAAIMEVMTSVVFSSGRDLVLTLELYTLAARDPAYRDITNAWMTRSRRALEKYFDPTTARILDALIEGFTIHRALDNAAIPEESIVAAIQRATGSGLPPATSIGSGPLGISGSARHD